MKITVEFEEGDLDPLHDIVYELTDMGLTNEQLETIWHKLPEHIKGSAYQWGLDDTCVRDEIYQHLEKEMKEYIKKII